MLKYVQRFGNIKTLSTFVTVLIQQRYTNSNISIQKKLLYNIKALTQWRHY